MNLRPRPQRVPKSSVIREGGDALIQGGSITERLECCSLSLVTLLWHDQNPLEFSRDGTVFDGDSRGNDTLLVLGTPIDGAGAQVEHADCNVQFLV